MEIVTTLLIAVSLSAACGFRVFVPLLVMGIAHQSGHLTLAANMEWIGSWPALAAFGAATGLEIAAYYVPWIDNALDSITTPAAFIAGTLVSAATIGHIQGMSPLMQWSVAAIAGGGAATVVQGATVVVRATSSLATGGIGNPVVSTTEVGASTLLSILAVAVPIVAGFLLLLLALLVVSVVTRRRRRVARIAAERNVRMTEVTTSPTLKAN